MNSNYGKSNTSSGSLNSFNFDLGLKSGRQRSLNDQKGNTSTSSYMYASTQPKPNTGSSWASQPNRPSWTHQPAAAAATAQPGRAGPLSGPTSMVGDIFGKSWSSGPSTTGSSIGIVKKDPTLFGDLVNSALGQNKGGNGNVPLKNAGPTGNKSTFSMGGMADSLPKMNNSVKSGGSWGSTDTSAYNANKNSTSNVNLGGNNTKGANLGGPSLKSMNGTGSGIGMNSNKDPFGNLVDFSAKPSNSMNSGGKAGNKNVSVDDSFGEFQNSSKTNGSTFSSNAFHSVNNSSSMESSTGAGYSKVDDFGVFNTPTQPSSQPSGVNDFDSIFAPSTSSSGGTAKVSDGFKNQQFSGGEDWGMDEEFGGEGDTSGTTELEGLPPPPAGVSALTAKNKGMENYKSGQYADAIKWLSWAIVLLERAGDDAVADVLSSRASCYKEVGEYKKAVADCTKVLEQDGKNVAVLVQRALLYESMEKYKLGAEDLRTVMKLDPINRVARSTIHRLTQMAG